MKLLLDMNLSPLWVEHLRTSGWEAVHWSEIGDIRAPDTVIMQWALENGFIVFFTHDLDFGALLAATRANGPSVIQIRSVYKMFFQRSLPTVWSKSCKNTKLCWNKALWQ